MKKRCNEILGILLIISFLASYVTALDNPSDIQVYRSTKIWTNEPIGNHIFFISSVDIAITQISFETINELSNAKLIIEAQKNNPSSLMTLDNAYQYLTIGKFGMSDDSIRDINLQFRIDKSSFTTTPNQTNVVFYYFDNTWKSVKTNYLYDDQSFYYYQSNPPKFTYYAITVKEKEYNQTIKKAIQQNPNLEKILNNSIQPNNPNGAVSFDIYGLSKIFFSSKKNTYLFIGFSSGIIILIVILFTFLNLIMKGDYLDNTEDIQKIIDEELSEGVPKKEIEKEIINSGWPKRVVDKIVHNERLPHETEIKIKAYIQKMREKTLSIEQIKVALLKEGWDEAIIMDLIKDFTSS